MNSTLVIIISIFCFMIISGSVIGLLAFKTRDQAALQVRLAGLKHDGRITAADKNDKNNRKRVVVGGHIWKFLCACMKYDARFRIYKTVPPALMFTISGFLSIIITGIISSNTSRVAWMTLPFFFVLLVRLYLGQALRRFHKELFRQFPDALGTIVRCSRVGISIPQAIEHVAESAPQPTRAQFESVAEQLSIGAGMEEALERLTQRNALQEYKFFSVALALQNQTGGSISETLENLSDIIRKRNAAQAKGHALIAEAKMSTMVLAGLPIVTFVGLYFSNYSYLRPLFTEVRGHEILAAAVFVWALGLIVMRSMIQRVLS